MLDHFICPLTLALPIDPVVAVDGQVYECDAIATHLEQRNTSPISNLPMGFALHRARHVLNVLYTMAADDAGDKRLMEWKSDREQLAINSSRQMENHMIRFLEGGNYVQHDATRSVSYHELQQLWNEYNIRRNYTSSEPSQEQWRVAFEAIPNTTTFFHYPIIVGWARARRVTFC